MVVLDTHLVLRAALQPQRLPAKAAKLPGSRNTDASFSVATLWEVAINTSLRRPDFTVSADELRRWLLSERFAELPIGPAPPEGGAGKTRMKRHYCDKPSVYFPFVAPVPPL